MQLYTVNFIPLLNSLYTFVPVAVDTVVLLMMGVCAARNM